MKAGIRITLLISLSVLFFSFDIPKGWYAAGSHPKSYEMGIAKGEGRDGKNCATIRSLDKKIKGFGTLMQSCGPGKYLGKRVRMTGYVKSSQVKNWAGIWFRVDKEYRSVSFDNMYKRPIKGDMEWKKYEIVLDVPSDATGLAYGVLLDGTGQVWFDDITFEIVDHSVPSTAEVSSEPQNLNFEE